MKFRALHRPHSGVPSGTAAFAGRRCAARTSHATSGAQRGGAAPPARGRCDGLAWLAVCAGALLVVSCEEPPPGVSPLPHAEGCVQAACHAGVEHIHYGGPSLSCTDCHLGNPDATTKEAAHVTVDVSFNPSTPGSTFLDDPPMPVLDALDPDVIQFLNPADYRVAMRTCGSGILGGGNCHTAITENSLLLNRATLAGSFAGGGFIAGLWDKSIRFGIAERTDPYVPPQKPAWAGEHVERPSGPPASTTDRVARDFFPVIDQLCDRCHLMRDGEHLPGLYYSSGCNGCHMLTTDDARSQTADVTQDKLERGHVAQHRFTNAIPDSQCAHCHISHLGRALLSRGVRERSEADGDTLMGGPNRGAEDPEHAVPWGKEHYVRHEGMYWLYGKPWPYFIEDEDGTNDVDETPPDIHTEKGLGCIDCHGAFEAHGDRHMAARMDYELDVRCESCHGRPGQRAALVSERGIPFLKAETSPGGLGEDEDVFVEHDDGTVTQLGKLDGKMHPVTQITSRTDPQASKFNPRTLMGCGLHAGTAAFRKKLKEWVDQVAAEDPAAVAKTFPGLVEGFEFEVPDEERNGRLECYACHNRWTVNCYGCHIVRDDRETYVSRLTGQERPGKVSTYGMSVLADALALGIDAKGRIAPMVGTSIFFTHIDADGNKVVDAAPLTTAAGLGGEGNVHNPVHHHTVRRKPRDCDGCHPSATGSHDPEALLRATGLGTGRYTFVDGEGHVHWLDRQVRADFDGDGVFDEPDPSALPKHVAKVERVVGTTHTALDPDSGVEPGPLDVTAINKMLGITVVPQRPDEKTPRNDRRKP